MALVFIAQPASWNGTRNTVSFHALDGSKSTLFSVPAEVLSDLGRAPLGGKNTCLKIFEENRSLIEQVATRVYESRQEDELGIYRLRSEDFR